MLLNSCPILSKAVIKITKTEKGQGRIPAGVKKIMLIKMGPLLTLGSLNWR